MDQARFFETNGVNKQELANATAEWFRYEGFDTYVYNDREGRLFVEAHKEGFGRSILGMNNALTVVFTDQPDGRVVVELGGAVWGDKLVSGAVGLLFFPPLAITAGIGAWQQSQLDQKVYQNITNYIYSRSGRVPVSTPATPYSPYGAYQGQGFFERPVTPPPGYGYGYYSQGYAPYGQQPPAPANWPVPTENPPRANWFDPDTMQPVFSSSYPRMSSWQSAIADGVINRDELEAQETLVANLQKEAEDQLDTNQKIKLAEVLAEMEKLEQMQKAGAV